MSSRDGSCKSDTGTSRYRGKRVIEKAKKEVDTSCSSVTSEGTLELDGAQVPVQACEEGPPGDLHGDVGNVIDTGVGVHRGKRVIEKVKEEVDTSCSSVTSEGTLELDGAQVPVQACEEGPPGDLQGDVGNVIDTGVGVHRGRLTAEGPQKRTRTYRATATKPSGYPQQPVTQARTGLEARVDIVRVQSGVRDVGGLVVGVLRSHVRQPSCLGSDSLMLMPLLREKMCLQKPCRIAREIFRTAQGSAHDIQHGVATVVVSDVGNSCSDKPCRIAAEILETGQDSVHPQEPCRYARKIKVAPGDGSLVGDSENSVKDIGVSDHFVRLGY